MPRLLPRLADDSFRRFGIGGNVRSQGRLDLWARCAIRLVREIRAEALSRTGIPWHRRIRAWRKGFRSIYAAAYGLDHADASLYVPDFAYAYRCYRMNGFWNPIIGNKFVVSQVLAAHGIPHPRVLGIVTAGRVLETSQSPREPEAAAIERWTDDGNAVVFRPYWSGGGEGVFFVQRHNADWHINGRIATPADLRTLLDGLDRYVATSFVNQADYARRIFPHTTNTLRVLTLIDDEGPFIASVAHRFGTARSFPLDNFRQGRGICAAVSPVTGILGQAVSLDSHFARIRHAVHPETGSPIEGVPIPGLPAAIEGALAAASCFPEATCVGWDIVITNDGFSVLEANAPPGIVVSQLHEPLLANRRVARFFKRHGFSVPAGT
jgi:hypothetical protein